MPFMRWRTILINWINCYCGGTDWQSHPEQALDRILDKVQTSSVDSLVSEEQNLIDFIADKYPEFQFENGTTTPSSDDDWFMLASLLLLFVCVKSKDAEMRNTMCKKLKREDQEVVLKFTKNLMNKTQIKYADVCTAIIESTEAPPGECTSTPPPLRALHSEVRRLRAALDAERFDRTYLQDELHATNIKLEKLVKDKEQYQKEVTSLKTQLTDQQNEPQYSSHSPAKRNNRAKKLQRELAIVEEKLLETQGMLEDSERAKDIYKNKIEELIRQRDVCASHASAEMSRACALAEQLEAECNTNKALLETVAELRASRELRRQDTSVECDEELTGKSFFHDNSICGEACTNIVEMQLLEERARISSLSEELHTYQDKVKELEAILTQKENELSLRSFDLKEEIKAKEEMAALFSKQQSEMQLRLNQNLQVIQKITLEVDRAKSEMETMEAEYKKIIKRNEVQIKDMESMNAQVQAQAEQSIETLNNKVQKLKVKKETMTKRIIELEKGLQSKDRYICELRSEINKLTENTKIMSKTIEDMSSENNNLMKEIKDITSIITAKKHQMEELQIEFVKLKDNSESTLDKLSNKLNNLNTIKDKLEERITDRDQIIANNNSQLDQLKNYINQLKDELKMRNMDFDLLKIEKENLTKNITLYESNILMLNKESEVKKRELQKISLEKENLEKKGIELEKIIKTYQLKIDELQNDNVKLKDSAAETEMWIKLEIEKFNAKKGELEKAIMEYEQVIKWHQDETVRIQAEYEQKLHIATESFDRVQLEVNKLNDERLQLENNIVNYQTTINNVDITVFKQQNEIKSLKNEIHSLNVEIKELMDNKRSLEKKLTDNENIMITHEEKMVDIQTENDNNIKLLSSVIKRLANDKFNLVQELHQVEISKGSQMSDLTNELEKLMGGMLTKISSLTESLEDANKEKSYLENSLGKLTKLVTSHQSQLIKAEKSFNELNTHAKSHILSSSEKMKSLLEKLCELFDNKDITTYDIDKSIEQLSSQHYTFAKSVAIYDEQMEKTAKILEKIANNYLILKSENAEIHNNISEKTRTIELKMKQIDLLNNKVDTLNTELQEYKKENNSLCLLNKDLKVNIEQLQKDYDTIVISNDQLSEKLSNISKKLELVTINFNNKTQEFERILEKINKENELLRGQVHETNLEMQSKIEELVASREVLEKETIESISEKQLKIEELEDENIRCNGTIASYRFQIESLETEIENTTTKLQDIVSLNMEMETKRDHYKTEIVELEKQLEQLQKEKELLSDENNEVKILVDQLQKDKNELIIDKEESSIKLSNMLQHLNETKKAIKINIKKHNNVVRGLEDENEQLKLKSTESINIMTKRINEINDNRKKFEKEVARSFNDYRLKIKELEENNAELSKVIESSKSYIDSINSELNSTKLALQDFSNNNETLKGTVIEYKTQINELSTENEKLKSDILEVSTTLSNKLQNLNTLEHCLEKQTEEYNNLTHQHKKEIEQLKSKCDEMSEFIITKNIEIENNSKEHDNTVSKLTTSINDCKQQIHELKNESLMFKTNEKLLKEQILELTSVKMALEEKLKENESIINNIELINITLKEEISNQMFSLNALQKDNEQLKSKGEEMSEQIVTKDKEIGDKLNHLNILQRSLEEQTKEYYNLSHQLNIENERLKSEAEEMSESIKVKSKEIEDNAKEHQKTINQMSTTIEKLKNQIQELLNECNKLKTSEAFLTTEITELNTAKTMLEKKLNDIENVVGSIKLVNVTMKEQKDSLELKLENVSSENNQLMKQKNILTSEIEYKNKIFEEELTILHCKSTELEHKVSELESEINNLVRENSNLILQLNDASQTLTTIRDKLISLVEADISPEEINSAKEIEELIFVYVGNLKDTNQSIHSKNLELQDYVSNLTSELNSIKEGTYSSKLKLEIMISQNNGYLDTMTKDTDLFVNKYKFVDVSQESCHVPDANDSFENFITAIENILLRNKTVANVFKTEYKSLSESHKQLLVEKENDYHKLKNYYEEKLQFINNQLLNSNQIVSKLQQDIAAIEIEKNTVINNLNEQLEMVKAEDLKKITENTQRIEELNAQLENVNKISKTSILDVEEEFKTKEESLKKQHAEHMELLEKQICESRCNIVHSENCLSKLFLNVTAIMNNFKSNLLNLQNSEVNTINDLNNTSSTEMVMSNYVGSLCDEDKIKSTLSSSNNDFEKILIDLQELIDASINLIKDTKNQLKIETVKTKALQTELFTNERLVKSLELDINKVKLKLDEVGKLYSEAIKQNVVLSDLIKTKENEIKISKNKLEQLESNATENDKIYKDLTNKLTKATTERDKLQERLSVTEAPLKEFINLTNTLVTISELNRPDFNENLKKLIHKFKPEGPFVQKLEDLFTAINGIIDKNKDLQLKFDELQSKKDSEIKILSSEVERLKKNLDRKEDLIKDVQISKEKDLEELQIQVKKLLSDLKSSSEEQNETIQIQEKIIHDKNKTITTLQSDITYMKSLVAESENKLLDITKEYEQTKENYQQLSVQSKKSGIQKDEEIANLKKQLHKFSSQESSANQIIKVSAKYHAMILKRIAELKSSAVLRELTHVTNIEENKKLSLSPVTVTADDLESFLESTDKHLRKLVEKQLALQKERDRLAEVCKINESETLSLKKYLTELLAHFKTFTSVKEVYNQKLNQVILKQRLVRREIHSLDQNIPDSIMSKLERSYSIVMQDLCETSMNLGRWAEKCIDRSISPEKLKQVFANSEPLLSTSYFHNTELEIQIEELMISFKKVYEEVQKAKSSGVEKPVDAACSVMQVRAEYEDKLNRMKAKMKQLYQEQMSAHQSRLDSELDKMRRKMEEKSKAYEEHIKSLTQELWSVGEKLLMKKEEADWLKERRPANSGSLMSLQMVHSSGLTGPRDSWQSRGQERVRTHADTQSLHRFTQNKPAKQTNRGFHMSDEEGEVFDNRWLRELESPPRERDSRRATAAGVGDAAGAAGRVSELKYRNSLCPPHLKSSYPAETHFAPLPVNEEEIKFENSDRRGRKEVGITAYKKPGPPTPSKNAGRLSATDSELRESLRSEPDAANVRKTSTPSRLRALFRSNRADSENSTPKSKRLSIFRKRQ